MFENLFSKPTNADLLKILKKSPFNEKKANSILEHVNINSVDNEGKTFLHHLCTENITEPLNWLVKQGINKELADYYDNTALNLAISTGSFDSFYLLLKEGYNVDQRNRTGRTVLQDSLLLNDSKFYKSIKKYSKNINNIDDNGKNILFDVLLSGNNKLIEEVLLEDIDKSLIDKDGRPALFSVQVLNNIDLIKLFVDNHVNISLKDSDGNNILYHILESETIDVDVVNFVLEHDFEFNSINEKGNTVLMEILYVIYKQNSEGNLDKLNKKIILNTVDKLIEQGIDINLQNGSGQNALMIASKLNNIEVVKRLINNNVQVNMQDNDGDTALSLAAIQGNSYKEVIFFLVVNSANAYLKDVNNQTVIDKLIDAILHLHNKKRISSRLIMKMNDNCDYFVILKEILVKIKIDLYSLNSQDEPYFFEAIVYGNTDLFKLIIQAGYHIDQPDINGLTVIYKLMSTFEGLNNEELKQYYLSLHVLLDMRANVNARDSFGGTTLHKAILANDLQTVHMLLNANVDLDAKDDQGRNYIHNSIWKNKVQIMRAIHSLNTKLLNTPDKYGVLPINYAAFLGYTDLVIELINLGSIINNTSPKKKYILEFLKKFHKNILPMFRNTRNSADEQLIAKLIKNMRQEFKF